MGINEALWEFPCDIQLKVMGLSHHPLADIVTEIVERHVTHFDRSTLSVRNSSSGKYISVTVTVPLTRKEQVDGIYSELDQREEVAWKL